MAYSTGMLSERVKIIKRISSRDTFGEKGCEFVYLCTVWANITFNRGVKSLREGALDAYDTIMVRMRWVEGIDRYCLLYHAGRLYDIQSLNGDKRANTIQITAREVQMEKSVEAILPQ